MDKTLRSKRPEDRLDYDIDFTRWLPEGDTIQSILAVSVTGGTVVLDGQDFTGTAVKVWLDGGADGETVTVKAEVATVQGREKEWGFQLRVREC